MIRRVDKFCSLALLAALAAGISGLGSVAGLSFGLCIVLLIIASAWFAWKPAASLTDGLNLLVVVAIGAAVALNLLYSGGLAGNAGAPFWIFVFSLWALVWRGIDCIASFRTLNPVWQRTIDVLVPVLFGAWMIFLWEIVVVGFAIPQVLLPSPSMIAVRFVGSLDILRDDFYQTFMKAVLAGYVIGSGTGFLTAILVDRVPFLKRGLLPLGNLVSALPIVGVAPIMVMWFGFDWQSKAAVVVIMTFFPMLVNAVTGLSEAGALEKDLMRSYGAGYWQQLFKLRLPTALPFIFNALKINSTLAMIGAIVAEFFGTPIVGMGFRISTEVGRMNVDMVWAEIVVAAIAGSAFYGMMALLERKFTFWHASYRHTR